MAGASNKYVRVARIVLKGPYRIVVKYTLKLVFEVTNIVVKYEALAKRLDLAREIKP